MRPQLGSAPAHAVFTSGEFAMALPICRASPRVRACSIFSRTTCFTPSLAGQIVADGEGVKHVVRLNIEQARTRGEARQIGSAIANSPLVKTAWAGADPNWGRILAAIGYSGVKINPERINIYLGEQQICRHGAACPFDHNRAHAYMSEPVYEIRIALGAGAATLEYLSCDLTAEYVRIHP